MYDFYREHKNAYPLTPHGEFDKVQLEQKQLEVDRLQKELAKYKEENAELKGYWSRLT